MDTIPFCKMSGSGNDFIIVDNRRKILDENELKQLITGACRRRVSVGADGFILVESSQRADFKWRFYNSDGGRAEMCGNGARCVSRFAFSAGIAGPQMVFETDVGLISAEMIGDRVKIKMTDPSVLEQNRVLRLADGSDLICHCVNTGVPHAVLYTDVLTDVDVKDVGRQIRYHEAFAPAGTNVNFIALTPDGSVHIRTYERGVEDETLACGTGSVAAALVVAAREDMPSPVRIKTRSAEHLKVYFSGGADGFEDIYLEGDARLVYRAQLLPEAWR